MFSTLLILSRSFLANPYRKSNGQPSLWQRSFLRHLASLVRVAPLVFYHMAAELSVDQSARHFCDSGGQGFVRQISFLHPACKSPGSEYPCHLRSVAPGAIPVESECP